MAYIYQIVNDINGKIYVGKTEFSIEKRFQEHCKDYKKESEEKRPLYAAMRKYGIEHFHISILEETDNPEEKEKEWIEKLGSFKNGYNATMGGDGKKYIDYDLVVETYKQLSNKEAVARILGIHPKTVKYILEIKNIPTVDSNNIMINQYGKIVNMYDLSHKYIQSFSTLHDAARYMINNNLTNCKLSTIRTHISEVCRGKRKTAAGFIWKFNK